MIRETERADSEALLAIVKDSGQFDDGGFAHVKETLGSYLDGKSDGLWLTADDGEPVGVAYCAPEPVTDGTWNLLMLWTRRDRNSQGHGSALVSRVEKILNERGVRLLIVETSGLPDFAGARSFYDKCGFTEEARIRNFFAAGDDKIVYTKSLGEAAGKDVREANRQMKKDLETQENLSALLARASEKSELRINQTDVQMFVLKPKKSKSSALDAAGVDLGISTKEIVEFVREGRERL